MRILDITTTRSGSTGRNSSDLKEYVLQQGEEYRIAFSEKDNKPMNEDMFIGNSMDHTIHAFLSRLFGLQGYFSHLATKGFLREVMAYNPDLVVMGNLHANYINLPTLFAFLAKRNIPVVMILHDCWFFTGKCTHFTAIGCDRWKTQCGNCPALKRDNASWFLDESAKMFQDRKKWYGNLMSLTVVAVSEWERELARQSPLLAGANVIRIYNWINTDVFRPATKAQIQGAVEKYKLSLECKYVISVSAAWSVGHSKTQDAIALANQLPEGYRLIVVGRAEEGTFPNNVVCIPHTSDQHELSVLYSLSSAYLHFSVEDTFGKVIAEAMSSGTVPIVFDSTACGEIAGPYGVVVAPHDVSAMCKALADVNNPDRRKQVREYALVHYNSQTNKLAYFEMFKKLVSDKQ